MSDVSQNEIFLKAAIDLSRLGSGEGHGGPFGERGRASAGPVFGRARQIPRGQVWRRAAKSAELLERLP